MMIDELRQFVRESHVGLTVHKCNIAVGMVPIYSLEDSQNREVYRGNVSDILAFINGCKYTIDLYEGH